MQLHLTERIIDFCADFITRLGYTGIFLLMFAESTYVPMPSFAVMPFVGFVAHQIYKGTRTEGPEFWLGILSGVVGGLCGCLATYYLGLWAGPAGVKKIGRYAGVFPEDLDRTHEFFERRGALAIFFARFIPVIRHLISTVAGIARMRLPSFVTMSVAGMFVWDTFLAGLGWKLEDQYPKIHEYTMPIDVAVILIFGGGAVYLLLKLRQRVKMRQTSPAPDLDAPKVAP
jgi:membrane protein DedA with SNARE-associated domain